jgi:hypothetical protein
MILYRHTPKDYPFIWESSDQPAGRWHAPGEGPVHYFADTPDGAWAEFLRHNEIDPDELQYIERAFWVIDVDIKPVSVTSYGVPYETLTGDKRSYPSCQKLARQLRENGISAIVAPSAALRQGAAHGWRMDDGIKTATPRNGNVFVVFSQIPQAVAWIIGICSPPEYISDTYIPL